MHLGQMSLASMWHQSIRISSMILLVLDVGFNRGFLFCFCRLEYSPVSELYPNTPGDCHLCAAARRQDSPPHEFCDIGRCHHGFRLDQHNTGYTRSRAAREYGVTSTPSYITRTSYFSRFRHDTSEGNMTYKHHSHSMTIKRRR